MKGYRDYYNIVHDDGIADGLYLRPPTEEKIEAWTLILRESNTPEVSPPKARTSRRDRKERKVEREGEMSTPVSRLGVRIPHRRL